MLLSTTSVASHLPCDLASHQRRRHACVGMQGVPPLHLRLTGAQTWKLLGLYKGVPDGDRDNGHAIGAPAPLPLPYQPSPAELPTEAAAPAPK